MTYKRKNILLVEDNSFIGNLHAQILRDLTESSIYQAKDGKQAIKFLDTHDVDLLITDLQLPVMNGLELIKALRTGQTKAPSDLPVLVVSGYSVRSILSSSCQLDINGFLAKPISATEAQKKLEMVFSNSVELKNKDNYESVEADVEKLFAMGRETENGIEISLAQLEPGMVLTQSILTEEDVVLLEKDKTLSASMLQILRAKPGYKPDAKTYVYSTSPP